MVGTIVAVLEHLASRTRSPCFCALNGDGVASFGGARHAVGYSGRALVFWYRVWLLDAVRTRGYAAKGGLFSFLACLTKHAKKLLLL